MHSKSVQFLSTPSARRATATAGIGSTGGYNFYPRPPRGGRPGFVLLDMIACYFYPRPPRGGRPVFPNAELYLLLFLSTPSARRATRRTTRSRTPAGRFLSTPSARRATSARFGCSAGKRFLSTPSARRATGELSPCTRSPCNFYPRPPRGGRRLQLESGVRVDTISIHALREEGDQGLCCST